MIGASRVEQIDDVVGALAYLEFSAEDIDLARTIANQSDVFNQDIIIEFAKETGAWKVDNAFWQN